MSRLRLPRRFAPLSSACAAILVALLAIAPAAMAQRRDPLARDRDASARTMLGFPNANACTQAAARADASDTAMAACNQAVDTERLSRALRVAVLANRGTLHLRRHEGQAALADFDAVLAVEHDNPEAYLNRGAALVMVGQPGQAVASITQALSLGVREPNKAYLNRGAAREALGDLRGAYEDYRTALEIVPDWGPANAELARFARTRRDALAQTLADNPTP